MPHTVWVNGQDIQLTPTMLIGKGGEAEVYAIGGGKAIKLFKSPSHPDFDGHVSQQNVARQRITEHQQKLRNFPKKLPSRVIVPMGLATNANGNKILGYVMQLVQNAQVLMHYAERSFRSKGIHNDVVTAIFADLYPTVQGIHAAGAVIGDFNDLNVLVKGKEAYIVDADSFQLQGYPCTLYTARFVDPLLCDQNASRLILTREHTQESDWYAYTVMLMQSLLFVDPYGGIFSPKDTRLRIPHGQRPLKRISVFHTEMRYPKPASPLQILPDALLDYFYQVFTKDKRGIFPLALLQQLRFRTCPQCGTEFARGVCPVCSFTIAIPVVPLPSSGTVLPTRVFHTTGVIVFAALQQGKLQFLYHEHGVFKRENGTTVLSETLDPSMRYRIWGDTTLIGKNNTVVTFYPDGHIQQNPVDTFQTLPMFDANERSRFWTVGGHLYRDGQLGSEIVGNVLSEQTLFWVGPTFGFGFSQSSNMQFGFVFDVKGRTINDNVSLPRITGTLIDTTCVFTSDRCWFFTTTQDKGRRKNYAFVIRPDGSVEAQAEADLDDDSWLGTIRGKAAIGKFLFTAMDTGLVRVSVENGVIGQQKEFPNTEPYVAAGNSLFIAPSGIYVVKQKEVILIKLSA